MQAILEQFPSLTQRLTNIYQQLAQGKASDDQPRLLEEVGSYCPVPPRPASSLRVVRARILRWRVCLCIRVSNDLTFFNSPPDLLAAVHAQARFLVLLTNSLLMDEATSEAAAIPLLILRAAGETGVIEGIIALTNAVFTLLELDMEFGASGGHMSPLLSETYLT